MNKGYNNQLSYFKGGIELANNMNKFNNNNWNEWYKNYLHTLNPNSNYGSLTLEETFL